MFSYTYTPIGTINNIDHVIYKVLIKNAQKSFKNSKK